MPTAVGVEKQIRGNVSSPNFAMSDVWNKFSLISKTDARSPD